MALKENNCFKPENGKYSIYDKDIPNDNYEVASIVQNIDGTKIILEGANYTVNISFGFVKCICICDEGARIESYNRLMDIQQYRKEKFFGNPLYSVSRESDFMKWLEFESCGFSCQQNHYAIITLNDFIDIAADFPPKISFVKKSAIKR